MDSRSSPRLFLRDAHLALLPLTTALPHLSLGRYFVLACDMAGLRCYGIRYCARHYHGVHCSAHQYHQAFMINHYLCLFCSPANPLSS